MQLKNFIDTTNPDFSSTLLGQKYHNLKSFINIHKKLSSCSKSNSVVNDDILYRAQSNVFLNLENPDYCQPVSSNSESELALLGNHLQQIARRNNSKTSSFEDNLFSQALQTSIHSRVTLTKQFGNDDINTPNFTQKLLDQLCEGDVLTSTSRGLRKKRDWVCTEKDKAVINNLIREIIKEINNKELIQHPTKFSQQKEECFSVQRNKRKKCVNKKFYEFQSMPPVFAEDNQIDSLDVPTIVADINYRISRLNSILEDYNEERKELENKLALEEQNINQEENLSLPEQRKRDHNRSLKRKKLQDELKRLKRIFFLDYKQELSLLHANGAGALLQTDVIRNQSKFKELEQITTKNLGLSGFEEAELTHKEDFPLLKPIDDHIARSAKRETLLRIDKQIQTLLSDQRNKHKIDQEYLDRIQNVSSEEEKQNLNKWYQEQRFDRLSKLILSNPKTISPVLLNSPEYSSLLCEIADKIEKDEKFKETLKTGLFIGSALGSVVVGTLTAGTGAPPTLAATASLATAVGVTAADFTLRMKEMSRHSRNQEAMLNAYLSQTGDEQSIVDIRKEWKLAFTQGVHAKWTLALGTFDLYRIGSAI